MPDQNKATAPEQNQATRPRSGLNGNPPQIVVETSGLRHVASAGLAAAVTDAR